MAHFSEALTFVSPQEDEDHWAEVMVNLGNTLCFEPTYEGSLIPSQLAPFSPSWRTGRTLVTSSLWDSPATTAMYKFRSSPRQKQMPDSRLDQIVLQMDRVWDEVRADPLMSAVEFALGWRES